MLLVYELIKAIILGVIQGITEWLPVSSTGHMILADEFIRLAGSSLFVNTFLVVVQLGSVLAVIILYFTKLNPYDFKTGKFKSKTIELWKKIMVASIPAAFLGLALDDVISSLFYNPVAVAMILIIYGCIFIILERYPKKPQIKSLQQINYKTALKIGGFQVLALIPGTSRSGATIFGGLMQKVDRETIAEFSFFMSIPILLGASLLKLTKNGLNFTVNEWSVLAVGCLSAFVVSIFAIKYFMAYIKTHDFKAFGWYRIALGLVIIIYFLVK